MNGAITDAIGAAVILVGVSSHDRKAILAGAVVSLGGLFMIFEGVKGWCALRAMGFKTRL